MESPNRQTLREPFPVQRRLASPPAYRRRKGRAALLAAILVVGLLPRVASADAQSDYNSLFGEDEKKAVASYSSKDDIALAARLLSRAAELKDAPELQRIVLSHAVALGQKDPDGYQTAITAAKQFIDTSTGAEKLEWQGKLVDLYALQYKRATGAQRVEAGNFLINMYAQEAELLAADGKYADSIKRLSEAKGVAQTTRNIRLQEITERTKDIQDLQGTATKLERLKSKLDAQGGDVEFLEQLIYGYFLDLGNIKEAVELSSRHPDKSWESCLRLAEKDEKELSQSEAETLADWYKARAKTAADSYAIAFLGKADRLYEDIAAKSEKKDAKYVQLQQSHASVIAQIQKLMPGSTTADRVVVWNQHNGLNNDRGTGLFRVVLMRRGRPVFSKSSILANWESGKPASNEVALPPILFDTLRVEILSWRGLGGGLAEVEIFRGPDCISKGARVASSGHLTPDYDAIYVVDGTNTSEQIKTFWLLPNASPGWVEITPIQLNN